MKRVLWLSFLLTVLPTSVAVAEERGRVDLDKPMVAGLSKCLTASQLDCIESVSILLKDGKRLVANQASVDNQADKDAQQQVVESGESSWEYTNTSGVSNPFILISNLTTPGYVVDYSNNSNEVTTSAESEAEGENYTESTTAEVISSDSNFYEPSLSVSAIFPGGNSLNTSKKFLDGERLEIVIRTSWLQIEEVILPGKDSEVEIEKTSQGKRITLRGSEDTIYSVESRKNQITGVVTRTIVKKENLEFQILHPKSKTEEKQCFESGYKISATNGSSLSLASEVQDYSLKFYASGYPFKTDKSANKGYAKVKVSLSWLDCKFPGNDFTFAMDFTAKVYSLDGGLKLQNTSANAIVKNGFLEIQADEFLFAKTEIRVVADAAGIASQKAKAEAEAKAAAELKAKQEAEAKAKSAAKKKTTITCVKGKLTKKVTAIDPKCPSGYKKKS
jgi:hypothetical protein